MAVATNFIEYRGLSSDAKPTVDPDGNLLPVGSRFYEVDTAKVYDWNGSAWVSSSSGSAAAKTYGGATQYSYLTAASANQDSQVIKNSAGQVYGWQLFNNAAAARVVKVYDKATGPTSADTPVKRCVLPANGAAVITHPVGVSFVNGIAFRVTTGVADSDATAATANDVSVNADYK